MLRQLAVLAASFLICSRPEVSWAVQLGGVAVPKQQLVVYILIGHSNMAGWSETADHVTHPRAWHFKLPAKTWVPAKAPLNPTVQGDGTHGGPGMPFLKKMVSLYPQHHIGVLQNAEAAATVRWNRLSPDTRYHKGTPLYDATIAAAKAASQQATLGGIICMLGWVESMVTYTITDTNFDAAYAVSFSTDIKTMVANMRGDLGQPTLPFLIGMYEESAPKKHPHRDVVIAEIAKIPGKVPYSAIIQSEGPYVDSHHFTYAGQVSWANAAAAIITGKGWFPAAKLALGKGVVTFSSVEGDPAPAPQQVSVLNNGKTVMATVSTKVVYGAGSGWLTVSASGSGNNQVLANAVSPAGLAPNTYTAAVEVSAPGALNNPKTYTVSLTVKPKPTPTPSPLIALEPSVLSFESRPGSGDPPPKVVAVNNSSSGALDVVTLSTAYLGGSGWLTTTTTGSGNSQSIENSVATAGLAPGSYTATVAVSSTNAKNTPQNYTVTLSVLAPDAGPPSDSSVDAGPLPDAGSPDSGPPDNDNGHPRPLAARELTGGCALGGFAPPGGLAPWCWIGAWLVWRGRRRRPRRRTDTPTSEDRS